MQTPIIITISWGEGKGREAKKAIVERLVPDVAEITGVPSSNISIFFNDIADVDTAAGGKYKG